MLANQLGESSVQPSLVLGCEQPTTGYHETNFSMAYGSHISWASATSPVPMEVYPSLAFDSLFENRGAQRTRSILDRVMEQAADLRRQASASDQAKLDEYLTSVREVERRIDRVRESANQASEATRQGQPVHHATAGQRPAGRHPRAHAADGRHPGARLPDEQDVSGDAAPLPRHLRDVLSVPARDRGASPALPQRHLEGVHAGQPVLRGQLAYLAQRLQSMPEGDGTVLDNSCLLFMSNMWSGSRHDSSRVPVLTLGNLGGRWSRAACSTTTPPAEKRRLCSLYLSLMDRMGVELPSFGDAAGAPRRHLTHAT